MPLQSVYCGAKAAIRGFTDSLRSEILHDQLDIRLTMVHLPAVNTPQFDWALNKTGRMAKPVPPIFQPEVPARAIFFAANHDRREIWVGFPTVKAILANRVAPGLLDRYLARAGYSGQLSERAQPPDAPNNLFSPVPGHATSHGRFDDKAHDWSIEMFPVRHKDVVYGGLAALAFLAIGVLVAQRRQNRDARSSRPESRRALRSNASA